LVWVRINNDSLSLKLCGLIQILSGEGFIPPTGLADELLVLAIDLSHYSRTNSQSPGVLPKAFSPWKREGIASEHGCRGQEWAAALGEWDSPGDSGVGEAAMPQPQPMPGRVRGFPAPAGSGLCRKTSPSRFLR